MHLENLTRILITPIVLAIVLVWRPVEYWIFQQKGKAKINAERIRILEEMGFAWDPQKVQWEAMYEKLRQFVQQFGHAKVPKGYANDTELANWVRNQRLEHRNWQQGKRSRMTKERFAMLDKLGFTWSQSVHSNTGSSNSNNDDDNNNSHAAGNAGGDNGGKTNAESLVNP